MLENEESGTDVPGYQGGANVFSERPASLVSFLARVEASVLIFVGLATIIVLTVATGYFVAQEFAYVAVDRGRLRALAEEGDAAAARALEGHLPALVHAVRRPARHHRHRAARRLRRRAVPRCRASRTCSASPALPEALSLSIAVLVALLFATVVQMVFGELAPKNLAIAKPVALARALSRSTLIYLAVAGPLIRLFDAASNRLLRRVGIEPVEELPQGATAEDLDRIIDESHARGAARRGHVPAAGPRAGLPRPDRRGGDGPARRRGHGPGDGPGGPGGRAARHRPHPLPGDRRRRRRRGRGGRDRRRGRPGTARPARTPPWARSRRRPSWCRKRCRCRRCWSGCAPSIASSPAWSTSTAGSPAS